MEEILLKLILKEYEITEEFMFSDSRYKTKQEALSMMTYILHVRYGWKISAVWLYYKTKGFKKGRAVVYHQLRRGTEYIQYYGYYRVAHDSIINGVELSKKQRILVEDNDDLHSIRGRITEKVFNIKEMNNLIDLEYFLDKTLESEFIEKRQYEKD